MGGGRRAENRESREKMRWWQHQDKENGNGIPGVRRAGTDYRYLLLPATPPQRQQHDYRTT